MITHEELLDLDFTKTLSSAFGHGYSSRKKFTKYNYVSHPVQAAFVLLHIEPQVQLPVFHITESLCRVRHLPTGEQTIYSSVDDLKGFIKEMDPAYDFGVYKEMDRIDVEANLKKEIVKNGFRYVVDPFLKDIYASQETFMKPAGYESMTGKPYEMYKYFIRFDEGKIKIYHMPSGDRETITTFEDIKYFMRQMKKLHDLQGL